MTIDTVLDDAMKLTPEEREELLARLVERTAKEAPPLVTDAWDQEIRRRMADIDAGRARMVPWSEALRLLRDDDR